MRPIVLLLVLLTLAGRQSSCRSDEPKSGNADAKAAFTPEQVAFFEKNVRPVLANRCLGCHGAKKQESGLRLDSRGAVLKGGEGGQVVVAGHPEKSTLIEAVLRKGGLEMPPDEPLGEAEILALTKWVEMGLPWPAESPANSGGKPDAWKSHWAFQPLGNPSIPPVTDTAWPRTAIDAYVLSRLEAAGVTPSAEADRRTLMRRAAFDLLGLPPEPDEVTAFENDSSPDAYERLIDRLLASPHYGERWGRHWLDVARYADNKGYVFFEEAKFPWAYTYRDYVIESVNADLPFDRFVLEQLGADQFAPGDDRRSLRALGFLTLGGRFMNNVHDVLDDQIDVVSRGLLGLTVTCARCHDHKYDPIPQGDYYALYGVFRSTSEPLVPPLYQAPPDTDEYRKFDAEMKSRLKKFDDFVTAKHTELVTSAKTRAAEYLMAAWEQRDRPPTDDFMLLVEKGGLNPMMVLRWQIAIEKFRRDAHPVWGPWHAYAILATEKFESLAAEVTARLAASSTTTGVVDPFFNPLIARALADKKPAAMKDVADCYAQVLNSVEAKWQGALKAARERGEAAPSQLADVSEEQLRQIFHGEGAPPDVPLLTGWGFLTLLPDRPGQDEFKKLLKDVETWSMTGPGAPPRAMVLVDEPQPHRPKIFLRGNPHRLGDEVTRHFPTVLDPAQKPFEHGSGRVDLARAIVDVKNPLTARVFVNRVWMHHFGNGLVETPSDFGLRSSPPSHPELLDHLARTFIEERWSIKRLHRRMMLSSTYRQQSDDARETPVADPTNRLMWKMNRRRLDFESTRDAVLAASGSLDDTIGGPSLDLLGGGYLRRRTMYGFIDRLDLPGLMRAFDFPDPVSTSAKRDTTTVAPQALFLMNNSFSAEAARRMAHRPEMTALASMEDRVDAQYQLAYGRRPTERELAYARLFLGSRPTGEIWTEFVQALLMSNEFVFVD